MSFRKKAAEATAIVTGLAAAGTGIGLAVHNSGPSNAQKAEQNRANVAREQVLKPTAVRLGAAVLERVKKAQKTEKGSHVVILPNKKHPNGYQIYIQTERSNPEEGQRTSLTVGMEKTPGVATGEPKLDPSTTYLVATYLVEEVPIGGNELSRTTQKIVEEEDGTWHSQEIIFSPGMPPFTQFIDTDERRTGERPTSLESIQNAKIVASHTSNDVLDNLKDPLR